MGSKTQENRSLKGLSGGLNVGTEEKEDIKEGFRTAFPKEPVWVSGQKKSVWTLSEFQVSLDFIRISWAFNSNVTVILQESDGM